MIDGPATIISTTISDKGSRVGVLKNWLRAAIETITKVNRLGSLEREKRSNKETCARYLVLYKETKIHRSNLEDHVRAAGGFGANLSNLSHFRTTAKLGFQGSELVRSQAVGGRTS